MIAGDASASPWLAVLEILSAFDEVFLSSTYGPPWGRLSAADALSCVAQLRCWERCRLVPAKSARVCIYGKVKPANYDKIAALLAASGLVEVYTYRTPSWHIVNNRRKDVWEMHVQLKGDCDYD